MSDLSNLKLQLDTADSAVKLIEPLLKRAEAMRYGQRLVAAVALVSVAASLVFGISQPRYTVAAVFLVMGVSFLTREPVLITARHVAIKDELGNKRIVLTAHEGAPTLAFLDQKGEVRFRCGLGATGTPSLSLCDRTGGIPRAMLAADPEATPSFVLTDSEGHLRLQFTLSPADQQGVIGVIGESRRPLLVASELSGRGHIVVLDGSGNRIWETPETIAA